MLFVMQSETQQADI